MRRSHVNVDWCSAVRNQPLFRSTRRSEEHQNEYPSPLVECHAPARTVVKLPEDFVLHSLRRAFRTPLVLSNARVAKSADAKDLKSFSPQGECGFKSRPGHQLAEQANPRLGWAHSIERRRSIRASGSAWAAAISGRPPANWI